MFKRTVRLIVTVALTTTGLTTAGSPADAAAVATYKNCADLNTVFKHGVGLKGAKDKVATGVKPVTNYAVNIDVYTANMKRLDRDKDGIACEKK